MKKDKGIPITNSTSIKNPSTLQPTFKLEMYAPKEPPKIPTAYYNTYVPKINLTGNKTFSVDAYNNLFAPDKAFSLGPNVEMPVQQVYNINLPGPLGDHVEMNKIYENILPGKDGKFTSTTLGERLQIYDYVRQILINISDGEDINIDSNEHHNLLSYIKLMELNPNYYSPLFSNPYRGLPYGLLIYRSCFPIRYDDKSKSTICSRNSFGMNIRLYSLSCAEFFSYKFRQPVYLEYDVWRELAFYEYIRENVLKKKVSPNFPILYCFFMCPNRKIDFFSLKRNNLTQKEKLTKDYAKFVKLHTTYSKLLESKNIIRPMTDLATRKTIKKLPDEIDPSLQLYSGTTLIVITEAPTSNLYQWASRIYEKDGIVRKMISHGYHDEKVWLGILFQIVSALYVLQLNGIYIRNMTIQDNVYIKDLQTYGKASGYWKYIIDGISYYVPNYGYVVLIDTNFKDIVPGTSTLDCGKREYKIYTSDIFGKKIPMNEIREKVFDNYRNIISTNSFTKEYTLNNVTKPPESIMRLLTNMMNDPEKDLGKVISNHFRQLMNNRIGTYLRKDTEVPNIRDITETFKYGDIAIEVIADQVYKWCLIIGLNDGVATIITRDTPECEDFITKTIRVESLKQYSSSEKIDQTNSLDINFSDEGLLETYAINPVRKLC
jgi:hypothetical protein